MWFSPIIAYARIWLRKRSCDRNSSGYVRNANGLVMSANRRKFLLNSVISKKVIHGKKQRTIKWPRRLSGHRNWFWTLEWRIVGSILQEFCNAKQLLKTELASVNVRHTWVNQMIKKYTVHIVIHIWGQSHDRELQHQRCKSLQHHK
jgi:hypothetical protein